MIRGGVAVYTTDWQFTHCKVYNGSTWVQAIPYVYNGTSWEKVGGAGVNMIPFLVSNGDDFYTSNNEQFLVREQ